MRMNLRSVFDSYGFPTVVCLCGSTRFFSTFAEMNFEETLAGRIVLSIGCDTKSDGGLELTEVDKAHLDRLHLQKVEMADEVLILNVGGYIGESTSNEMHRAIALRKTLRFLEEPPDEIVETMICSGLRFCGDFRPSQERTAEARRNERGRGYTWAP